MTPSLQKITTCFHGTRNIHGRSEVFLDECVSIKKKIRKYLNVVNSNEFLAANAPDAKVQQTAEELNKIVVTSDKGFVINVILKGKQIIFETKDKNLFLLKPIRIQTNCYKHRCPVTFFIQEFDEVILP